MCFPWPPCRRRAGWGPQSCISRRGGEGHWILGCSFSFNKRGWFLIKREVQTKLTSLGQSRHLDLREGGAASLCWGWDHHKPGTWSTGGCHRLQGSLTLLEPPGAVIEGMVNSAQSYKHRLIRSSQLRTSRSCMSQWLPAAWL